MFFRLQIKKIRDSLDNNAMKISAEKCTPKRKAEVVSLKKKINFGNANNWDQKPLPQS